MGQKDEIILININGTDRPGVTAALTEILTKNNAVILDIGQADIHNNLSLGILFQSSEGNSGDILKELLFKSYELDVNIRFNPIAESQCRILRARYAEGQGTDEGRFHETLCRAGDGYIFSGRKHVSTHASPDLLRYGFDID